MEGRGFFCITHSPFNEFSACSRPQSSPKCFYSLFPEVLSGGLGNRGGCPPSAGARAGLLAPAFPRQADRCQLMACFILRRTDSQPCISQRAGCEAWETELCQLCQLCHKPLAAGSRTGTTSVHAAKSLGRVCERVSVGPNFQGCPKAVNPRQPQLGRVSGLRNSQAPQLLWPAPVKQ